jgi:glucosamine kinase
LIVSFVAIDVGQSHVRAIYEGGPARRAVDLPGAAQQFRSPGVAGHVGRLLVEVLGRLDPALVVSTVAVGVSGFDGSLGHAQEVAAAIARSGRVGRVIIASDAVTGYLACLETRPGIVAAIGTGTVVLAADGRRWTKVDGNGHLLGDEGSGFRIGGSGLASALRASDGRVGSDALLARLLVKYQSIDNALNAVYGSSSPPAEVAAFALEVAHAARDGDEQASAIWRKAGSAIGRSLLAAHGALFEPFAEVPVYLIGSLTGAADLLLPSIREVLATTEGKLATVISDADPLVGVEAMVRVPAARVFPGLVFDFEELSHARH